MAELKQLSHSRKYLRQQVTRVNNNVKVSIDSLTQPQRQQLLSELKSLSLNLKDINSKIQSLLWDEANEDMESIYERELESSYSYDQKILESITSLENVNMDQNTNDTNLGIKRLKLPAAPLPKFSGAEREDFQMFIVSFEAIVCKFNYSSYEKYILLKEQLSGRASVIISSLESSKQSYEEAKHLLTLAFASPLTQKYDSIQRLIDLKLPYSKDPYVFVSEMRIIKEAFNNLKIDITTILVLFLEGDE